MDCARKSKQIARKAGASRAKALTPARAAFFSQQKTRRFSPGGSFHYA
jgi:hypothetical protein